MTFLFVATISFWREWRALVNSESYPRIGSFEQFVIQRFFPHKRPGFTDGFSLNQDQTFQLRYLRSFYKNALEKNVTGVHLEREQWH